ncbi:hypothetical protein ACV242_003150 [Peribacillus simplex]
MDEIQCQKSGQNYYSYSAEKMMRRATNRYSKIDLSNAETLLYYISVMKKEDKIRPWFPHSYIYLRNTKIEVLQKLESKRHFDKIKSLFDVDNVVEMVKKFKEFDNPYNHGYRNSFESVPNIEFHIDYSKIGVHK